MCKWMRWISGMLVAVVMMSTGCRRADQADAEPGIERPKKVTIGYQVIPNGEIVAKDKGWVEEEFGGVPIDWVQFPGGADVNLAMESRSVDIALGGTCSGAVGLVKKMGYEVVWIHDIIGDNEALVARRGSGVKTVADLVGRNVAVPFGTTTHYHLMVALRVNEIDARDVRILDMPNADALAAWRRDDIDAAFVWEPTLTHMVEDDGVVILSSRDLAGKGYLTADCCQVRKEFAAKYPDLVTAYLRAQLRAVDFCRENPGQAAAAVARQFSIDAETASRQMSSLIMLPGKQQLSADYLGTSGNVGAFAQVLKDTGDFMGSRGVIEDVPGLEFFRTAINPVYLEEALAGRNGE